MNTTRSLAKEIGVRAACESLGIARVSYYRWSLPRRPQVDIPEPSVASWSLSQEQRQEVLEMLHTERFVDRSPPGPSMRRCSMRGLICAPYAPCIGFSKSMGRFESGATSYLIPSIRNPSSWLPVPIRSGPGTLPSSKDR
jgi:hypothetical protein